MLSRPTLRQANLLFLLTAALIVTLGLAVQTWSMGWGLIVTEVFLILLPTLIAVRFQKLDWRDTLRLRRWPGWAPLALGLLIGLGLWPLTFILNPVSMLVLGYQPPSPFALSSNDPLGLALFCVGLVLLPPICEEVLFRGYILRAYEGFSFKSSVLLVGGLFALWHLRLQGLLPLLPIAFTLTYLARRSQSLLPAMLAHLATNGLSGAVTVALALNPNLLDGTNLVVLGGLGAFVVLGPLAALAGFWLFHRATANVVEPPTPAASAPAEKWFKPAWVFVVFGAIYLGFAGLELVTGRFPEVLARQRLETLTAPWTGAQHWTYELHDPLNAPIGQAECQLTPVGDTLNLDCQIRQQAFDTVVKSPLGGSGHYLSDGYQKHIVARYDAQTLQLRQAAVVFSNTLGVETRTLQPAANGTGLLATSDRAAGTLAVPAAICLPEEWRWRLSALPFDQPLFGGARLALVHPSQWSQTEAGAGAQIEDAYALVRGQETVRTPGGDVAAWRVTVGAETAWYDVKAPHPLVKFYSVGVTYVLTSATGR